MISNFRFQHSRFKFYIFTVIINQTIFDEDYSSGMVGNLLLAEDGIVMAIITLSSENGKPVTDPEIITRGFVYVKEAEALMGELKRVVNESLASCERQKQRDWAAIKGRVKSNISGYLYKTTRRSPMVLPVIIEV